MIALTIVLGALGALILSARVWRNALLAWYVLEARKLDVIERASDVVTTYPLH